MKYILSIDPGVSNGIALLRLPEDKPVELVKAWQFRGGAMALKDFLANIWEDVSWATFSFEGDNLDYIAEKFNARNTSGFSYTTASLEPLRGEGVLLALDLMPDYDPKEKVWRDPKLQYIAGGKDKTDKKKRQHAKLKEMGLYVTGKMLDSPDADDARSAIAHGVCYAYRDLGHKPTWDAVRGDSE